MLTVADLVYRRLERLDAEKNLAESNDDFRRCLKIQRGIHDMHYLTKKNLKKFQTVLADHDKRCSLPLLALIRKNRLRKYKPNCSSTQIREFQKAWKNTHRNLYKLLDFFTYISNDTDDVLEIDLSIKDIGQIMSSFDAIVNNMEIAVDRITMINEEFANLCILFDDIMLDKSV
ncbi:uncharacterized protein LOC106659420 [Trichogramma pretiosum]|uniref:uncharacterized protein LOC106659420 n=1 Tax=Trichogramma pretiosum TaxID=7493 RepID=UPI0006C9A59F|nr:uncharacterized protein LOC106659420 [Trichogramma pretiosum]